MLLKSIYAMSLEHPGPGFNGHLGSIGKKSTSLIAIKNYTRGYIACAEDNDIYETSAICWGEFLYWMKDNGHFPPEGWDNKIIREYGDYDPAVERFLEIFYEYLRITMPEWFVEFNSEIQRSVWGNANGPRVKDVRNLTHIEWCRNA